MRCFSSYTDEEFFKYLMEADVYFIMFHDGAIPRPPEEASSDESDVESYDEFDDESDDETNEAPGTEHDSDDEDDESGTDNAMDSKIVLF